MVRGMFKSKRLRQVFVKTPGGKVVKHYRQRSPSPARCALTGERLLGVPRKNPGQLKKFSKTGRRPERPYGGVLSSRALREVMKQKARLLSKTLRGEQE